jgi:hypothetical protein
MALAGHAVVVAAAGVEAATVRERRVATQRSGQNERDDESRQHLAPPLARAAAANSECYAKAGRQVIRLPVTPHGS